MIEKQLGNTQNKMYTKSKCADSRNAAECNALENEAKPAQRFSSQPKRPLDNDKRTELAFYSPLQPTSSVGAIMEASADETASARSITKNVFTPPLRLSPPHIRYFMLELEKQCRVWLRAGRLNTGSPLMFQCSISLRAISFLSQLLPYSSLAIWRNGKNDAFLTPKSFSSSCAP